MRDRLIELIKQGDKTFSDKYTGKVMSHIDEVYGFVADHLLSEGVIVPKVKIGDKLYELSASKRKIYEVTITFFKVYKDHTEIWGNLPYENTPHYICDEVSLGYNEWVCLTREEAERASERSANGT